MSELQIFNTLTRKKEVFIPLHAPFVGMYVCGPTVYGDAHLGHARPAITFDIVFRYLTHLGYKVRYVRNITDVGHLENDADAGEDKIAKKARLEHLEPMEVAQRYKNGYQKNMSDLNVLPPSIEPLASGHIIEQIKMIEEILEKGYAYVSNGSVYFDVKKYDADTHCYGCLSGRVLDELLSTTRELSGQEEKKESADFALWKKATREHIMRWTSPWSEGFPGWHIECTAMSAKYLGEEFDIHGGGMDLLFPHHESEIAQSMGVYGHGPCRYWMHNNMITINGQKMGKSLGNFITLDEFFSGSNRSLEKAFSPMTIRFFILQAHYRSTLDFTNEALLAAEKGFARLMEAFKTLQKLTPSPTSSVNVASLKDKCYDALNDDFNTPIAISYLFEIVKIVNAANDGKESLTELDISLLKDIFNIFVLDILGLLPNAGSEDKNLLDKMMEILLSIRQQAKENKDYATSDKIRNELSEMGITIKDGKEGSSWSMNN